MTGKAEIEIADLMPPAPPAPPAPLGSAVQYLPRTATLERVARFCSTVNELVGRAVSWLVLTMVLFTFTVAMLRYGFGVGWIWLQETYVWMHGIIIMIGAGYTLLHDGHVRVDVFYRSASARFKAWVNLLGSVFLLLPTIIVVTWTAWPYVLRSWARLETSDQPGGLPGLYLLKSTMLAFALLLTLQGAALLIRSVLVLAGHADDAGGSGPDGEGRG